MLEPVTGNKHTESEAARSSIHSLFLSLFWKSKKIARYVACTPPYVNKLFLSATLEVN